MPYLVAYAFQYGVVTPRSFSNEYIKDPAIQALIDRISIEEDSGFTKRFSKEYNCHMEVTTRSGPPANHCSSASQGISRKCVLEHRGGG